MRSYFAVIANDKFVKYVIASIFAMLAVCCMLKLVQTSGMEWLLKTLYNMAFAAIFFCRDGAKTTDRSSLAMIITFGHCLCPLLFTLGPHGIISLQAAAIIATLGCAISATAALDLWGSFGILPANRGIITGGSYQLVRHPVYLGYAITAAALVIFSLSTWNVVVGLLFLGGCLLRIDREETLLREDEAYLYYCQFKRIFPVNF